MVFSLKNVAVRLNQTHAHGNCTQCIIVHPRHEWIRRSHFRKTGFPHEEKTRSPLLSWLDIYVFHVRSSLYWIAPLAIAHELLSNGNLHIHLIYGANWKQGLQAYPSQVPFENIHFWLCRSLYLAHLGTHDFFRWQNNRTHSRHIWRSSSVHVAQRLPNV